MGELVPSEVPPKNTGFHAVFVLIFSKKDGIVNKLLSPVKNPSYINLE